MADTFTTTLNLTKPEVGASADTWGTKLNDNLDDLDALFSAGPVLKVANGGTAATTASGARTSLGLGTMATQDASAVAITGGSVVTGYMQVTAAEPVSWFYETDADADEKYWRFVTSSGNLYLQTYDDALTLGGSSPVIVSRTGTTVDAIALTATSLTFNGNAVYSAATFTAPTSGSFTISLRASTETGGVLGTGTAYWRKFNNVVTLRIPPIFPSNTATAFYLTGLPADIQVGALGLGAQALPITVVNGSVLYPGLAVIGDSVSYFPIYSSVSAWAGADSAKGVAHTCITYQIAD